MLFWQMYGRTGPRKVAWEGWVHARNGTGKHRGFGPTAATAIINGVEAWAQYWRMPGAASVKWPQGWLNERRWEDPPPVAALAIARSATKGSMAAGRARLRAVEARAANHGLPPYPANHGLPAPEGPQGRLL